MIITAEQREALKKFQRDPNLFFRKVLGCEPEEYQARINQAIADNERTAISACHDVGKSWDLARIVLWFLSCFPYSKVITTAPTFNQVKNILWAEMRAAYSASRIPLGGQMNLTEWRLDDDWFAIGFTPRNELSGEKGQGTQSSFQGFHARGGLLVVFDEATGIPKAIWDMAEGLMTQAFVKFVAIGNPTSRSSEFYRCFSSAAWHKVKLSCFDSPNLIANGITGLAELEREVEAVRALNDAEAQARLSSYKVVKRHLLSLKWVVSMAMPEKWGMLHPLFVSKVLGQFPEDDAAALISLGTVEAAQRRMYFAMPGDRKTIGVDVARYGSDATVLTGMTGRRQTDRKPITKSGATVVAGNVIDMVRERGADVVVVDGTGVGGGVVDCLEEAKKEHGSVLADTEIREVQFGARCADDNDHAKFANLKARMFVLLAYDLKREDGIQLLNEDVYLDELPTIHYTFDSKGRYVIESKDDYKRRTGRKSPDDSDSLALANFGHYDEIPIGRFDEQTFIQRTARPFAASLGADRKW